MPRIKFNFLNILRKKLILFSSFLLVITLEMSVGYSLDLLKFTTGYTDLQGPFMYYIETEEPLLPGMINAKISVSISNRGPDILNNVTVTLTPIYPFEAYKPPVSYLGDFGPFGWGKATFFLNINPKAFEDTYDVPLQVAYTSHNTRYVENSTIKLYVKGFGFIKIKDVTTIPNQVLPKKKFDLVLTLENTGSKPIYDLLGSIKSDFLATPETQFHINAIGIGSTEKLILPMFTKDIPPGLYRVELMLQYENRNYTSYIPLSVEYMLVDIKVKLNTSSLSSGKKEEISYIVENIGEDSLKNIKLTTLLLPPLTAIRDNEIFIDTLNPGESRRVNLTVYIDKKAEAKLYRFLVFVQYRDSYDKFYTKNSTFGIVVEETPVLYVQEIVLEPTKLEPGTDGLFMVRVVNTGTTNIEDVNIKIAGGEKILTQNYAFIGEVRPNLSETATFGVYVNPKLQLESNEETYGLNVIISYNDLAGESHSISKIFPVSVIYEPLIPTFYVFISIYLLALLGGSYLVLLIVGARTKKEIESAQAKMERLIQGK